MTNQTPKSLGFYFPAEWEKHSAIWLSWPYGKESFPGRINRVENTIAKIIKAISESEIVELLVVSERVKKRATRKLQEFNVNLSRVNFHVGYYADIWFRDYGPTFLVNREKKQLAMVDWEYNAYGEKFPALLKDNAIPSWMNESLGLPYFKPGIVLEGGSIESNGRGTIMTSEQCLLNKNRNPRLKKEEVEKYLMDYLSASHFIWLKDGISSDHTDGHIDNFARFVSPGTIMHIGEDDENDENYKIMAENIAILKNSTDQDGNKLKLISLPMAKMKDEKGNRLPVSYINFYIGNDVVLVPIFNYRDDELALEIIQKSFPQKKVIGINCQDLIYGGGTIHCISCHQPRV